MVDYPDLAEVAKQGVYARIKLPPRQGDLDICVVWVIGISPQLKFDRVIREGNIIDLPVSTTQRAGVINDQIVVEIDVEDEPGVADKINTISNVTSRFVAVASWYLARVFKKVVVDQIVIEIQKLRFERSIRKAKPSVRRIKKGVRISRSIAKRSIKQARLLSKIKQPAFIAGRLGATIALKSILIVGLAVDIALVSHAVFKGQQRAGLPGALGALVGGVSDVLLIGFFPGQTEAIGRKTEAFAALPFRERIKVIPGV